jgi:hypothetical protein
MNPVRAALEARLKADATLATLLSTGQDAVYHREAPNEAQLPLVIYHKQAGARRWTFGDFTAWDLWLVKGVARDSAWAEDIDKQIDVILSDAVLTISGLRHLYLRREDDVDYGDQVKTAGAQVDLIHYVGGIYRLVTGH